MPAAGDPAPAAEPPLLLVDVDGVVSLFGFDPHAPPAGIWRSVDGIPHLLSPAAGARLRRLAATYELVWCTGWEEKADAELPHAVGAPAGLPHLTFPHVPGRTTQGHWKLDAIDARAGDRALAWVDDALTAACRAWAAARPAPTLLVPTLPHEGLGDAHVAELEAWAATLRAAA